eukprot:6141276-Amphidinium_carterae.1
MRERFAHQTGRIDIFRKVTVYAAHVKCQPRLTTSCGTASARRSSGKTGAYHYRIVSQSQTALSRLGRSSQLPFTRSRPIALLPCSVGWQVKGLRSTLTPELRTGAKC